MDQAVPSVPTQVWHRLWSRIWARTAGVQWAIVILIFLPSPALAQPGEIAGPVTHVRDGDTIEIGQTAIRLNGLHAPELRQRGGRAAHRFMVRLVAGKQVRCALNGERTHDRLVGVCYLAGKDIARTLIQAGLGRDCPRYSGGRYRGDETPRGRRLPLPRYCR